jgi:hypothetical protein
MSGGHFDYNQYQISQIAEEVNHIIHKSGRLKTSEELKEESWRDKDWYRQYPEDLSHYKYPDEVIEEFKKGLKYLKLAYIYAQRIDWLISGDDGDETFLERLEEDLKELKDD